MRHDPRHRSKVTRRRTPESEKLRRLVVGSAIAVPLLGTATWTLWPDDANPRTHIVVIDDTGYTTSSANDRETAARAVDIINQAAAERGRLFVVPIGADANDATLTYEFDFDPDCPNSRVCDDMVADAAKEAATAIEELIGRNAGADATDVMSALRTATSLCRQHGSMPCAVHVISDGVQNTDQLSFLDNVPVDEAERLASTQLESGEIADMTGISVDWSGIGTDGSTGERAAALISFWTKYLTAVGVDQPTVARVVTD